MDLPEGVLWLLILTAQHRTGAGLETCHGKEAEICWCGKNGSLVCKTRDTLTEIPLLEHQEERQRITEISIEEQPRLVRLTVDQLKHYPNLEKLRIQDCGIREISRNAFTFSKKLKEVNLRMNNLSALHHEFFEGLTILELAVDGNPLTCNCSVKWLQSEMSLPGKGILGPYWDRLTCRHSEDTAQHPIHNLTIPDCEAPKISVEPRKLEMNASQSAVLSCWAEGRPVPLIRWHTTGLRSEYFLSGGLGWQNLTLTAAHGADTGYIACVASNAAGKVVETVQLIIQFAPHIEILDAHKGYYWYVSYEVTGYPLPTRTWYFNHQPIQQTENIMDREADEKELHLVKGALEIKLATPVNDGLYTLVVRNAMGEHNRSLETQFHNKNADFPTDFPTYPGKHQPLPFKNTLVVKRPSDPGHQNHTFLVPVVAGGGIPLVVLGGLLVLWVVRWRRSTAPGEPKRPSLMAQLFPQWMMRRVPKTDPPPTRQKLPIDPGKIINNPSYCKDYDCVAVAGIPKVVREKISFVQRLGEGAFGCVFLGTVDYLSPEEPTTLVAVKTLKDQDAYEMREDFYREAELLSSLQHPNIVRFFGVSVDAQPLMMLFEYMDKGDLNHFLRARCPNGDDEELADISMTVGELQQSPTAPLCHQSKLHVCLQIATGLKFLASQHFVHRDLATRNCLVGDPLVVKIGDFGLSRDVYSTDYYKVGRHTMLPIRWMPPESILYRKFTLESDVWSFGVVLWEVFTHGMQPWYQLSNHEVVQEVTNHQILPCPVGCSPDVYQMMKACWKFRPQDRISAQDLPKELQHLMRKPTSPEYLEVLE